ncbi:MAG: hypothetical protein AB7K71_09750 [Polyangiaceae bacterium]
MRSNKRKIGFLVAALMVGGWGVAVAQTGSSGGAPVDVASQKDENLSPDEQVKRADQYLGELERTASTIRKQLDTARQARDVVKVLCLDDKLNQVDVAIRSFKERQGSLKGAAERKDADTAKLHFSVIGVLRDRGRSLAAEANQCVGDEAGFVGETDVKLTIDPNIADTDPSEYPDDPLISTPPVVSSPDS